MSGGAVGAAVLAAGRTWAPAGGAGVFDSAWTVLRVLLVLALVVVLALITTRFLGRRLVVRRPGRYLELVETLPLGANRALCLARVEGRLLVLGVSEGGISRLLTLPGSLPPAPATAAAAPGTGEGRPPGPRGEGSGEAGKGPGAVGKGLGSPPPQKASRRPGAGFLGRLLDELGARGSRRG